MRSWPSLGSQAVWAVISGRRALDLPGNAGAKEEACLPPKITHQNDGAIQLPQEGF